MPHIERFDTSPYNKKNVPFEKGLRKVIGLMKDESGDGEITIPAWNCAKNYAYKQDNEKNCLKAKGVNKAVTKHEIRFENIINMIFLDKDLYKMQVNFKSIKHTMHTVEAEKKVLSNNDDKRIPYRNLFQEDKRLITKALTFPIGWNE